jgi:hypothetical protein
VPGDASPNPGDHFHRAEDHWSYIVLGTQPRSARLIRVAKRQIPPLAIQGPLELGADEASDDCTHCHPRASSEPIVRRRFYRATWSTRQARVTDGAVAQRREPLSHLRMTQEQAR